MKKPPVSLFQCLVWLTGCFFIAPFFTRIVLLIHSGYNFVPEDLAGFASDFSACLICMLLYLFIQKWSRIAAAGLLLFWGLFHYFNYEHITVNSDIISLGYIDQLASPTFLLGSGTAISNFALFGLLLLAPLTAFIIKPVRLNIPSLLIILSILSGTIAVQHGFTSVPAGQDLSISSRWRTHNVLHANLKEMLSEGIHHAEFKPVPEAAAQYERQKKPDLSGTRLFPAGDSTRNILLVIIESLDGSILPTAASRHGVRSTISMPALEHFAAENITYTGFINHQRQTNRGIFSMLCGDFPKLNSTTAKMTEYATHPSRECLPEILSSHGYHTAYMQGSPLPYMLKGTFMQEAGFNEVYGTDWFEKSYSKNYWGVDDKAFFEKASKFVRETDKGGKPWFITMLTVGTHHPLNAPADFPALENESDYHRTYRYLDNALGNFLRDIEQAGLLKNTLVILTSDESRGKHTTPSEERTDGIQQQWGLLTIRHPSAPPVMVHDRFCQMDIALSILDYLKLPVAEDRGPGGRSIFRKYTEPRDIYFGNTFRRITGRFSAGNTLDICMENFMLCEQYALDSTRFFSPNRVLKGRLPSGDRDYIRTFANLANSSVLDIHSTDVTYVFTSQKRHVIPAGPQKHLVGGQWFTIPRQTFVSVRLKGRVVSGDSSRIYMKHDLASGSGRVRINKFMYNTLTEGDTFSASYDFFNNETFYGSEFRLTAELISGGTAVIELDSAQVSYRFREPSREEHLAAAMPYDRDVGRDLGAFLTLRRDCE